MLARGLVWVLATGASLTGVLPPQPMPDVFIPYSALEHFAENPSRGLGTSPERGVQPATCGGDTCWRASCNALHSRADMLQSAALSHWRMHDRTGHAARLDQRHSMGSVWPQSRRGVPIVGSSAHRSSDGPASGAEARSRRRCPLLLPRRRFAHEHGVAR